MASLRFSQSLESAHQHLEALRLGDDGYKKGTIDGLMSTAYSIGKAITLDPKLRFDPILQRFVNEAVGVLKTSGVDLAYYPWTVVRQMQGTWENNEWEQLCVARSGIQFFIELFRETALADEVLAINPADIDEFIRERGTEEGYLADDEIPFDVPPSHWWWWYPEAPRNRPNQLPPK